MTDTSIFETPQVRAMAEQGLAEDRASEDVTTRLLVPREREASAVLKAKGEGVLAGFPLFALTFTVHDSSVRISDTIEDAEELHPGRIIARIEGPARSLLAAERTALNFLQHLSGIASMTRRFVSLASPYGTKIYDTRKTTPLYRDLEKYAVRMGGGVNHRRDLSDQVLVKENHLAMAEIRPGNSSGLQEAFQHVVDLYRQDGVEIIEIEVQTAAQAVAAAKAGADILLLDNFIPDQAQIAVNEAKSINPNVELEISGGVTLATVERYAKTGVDRISVGALTHSAPALDLTLLFE